MTFGDIILAITEKRKLPSNNYPYGYYSNIEAYEYAKNVFDTESMDKISSLTYKDLQEKKI